MINEPAIKNSVLRSIIKFINNRECLVILGPHLLSNKEGKSINAQLNTYLADELEDDVKYYDEEGFLSFEEPLRDAEIKECIKIFFDDLEPNELYEKIAEIPFSTIINTAPDKTLNKVFDKKGKGIDYDYYIKPEDGDEFVKEHIKKHATYIYNIFGDYENMDSMILTHKDLFDYLQSIISTTNLSIKNQLEKVETVLFFGFSFDKWYFQLLLWIMDIKEKRGKMPDIKQANIKEFYSSEFKVKFFDVETASVIIDQLYQAKLNGEIVEQEPILFQPQLFMSYNWEDESNEMANNIEKTLPDHGISLIRDKKHLGYGDLIKTFMNRINEANGAIVIISDAYLKSKNCMYELTSLYIGDQKDEESNEDVAALKKDNTKRKEAFRNRIFPIYMTDAKIFDDKDIQKYQDIWTILMKEKGAEADPNKPGFKEYLEEFQVIQQIEKNFTEVIMLLKGLNGTTPEAHINSGFKELIDLIKQRF